MPPKAFNPPRPSGVIKKTTSSRPAKTRKAAPNKSTSSTSKPKGKASKASPFIQTQNSDDDEDPFSEPVTLSSDAELEPEVEDEDEVVEDVDEEEDEEKAIIPPDLLTKLLHEFFTKDGTRISKDANAAIGRYVDVFVRESLARVVWAKAESAEGIVDNGFCEVEDLEKLAPQLLLDF